MRTPLLAGVFALLLPACLTGGITGVGDGTGSGSGSGDGSGSDVDNTTPRLDSTLDKTTVTAATRQDRNGDGQPERGRRVRR